MQMHSLYRSFTLFIVFVCFFPATKQLNDKILFYASNRSSLFLLLYVCVVMLHFHKQTDKTTVDFSLSKYFFSAAVSTLELLSIGNILERSIRSSLANRTNNTLILILALASCLKKICEKTQQHFNIVRWNSLKIYKHKTKHGSINKSFFCMQIKALIQFHVCNVRFDTLASINSIYFRHLLIVAVQRKDSKDGSERTSLGFMHELNNFNIYFAITIWRKCKYHKHIDRHP